MGGNFLLTYLAEPACLKVRVTLALWQGELRPLAFFSFALECKGFVALCFFLGASICRLFAWESHEQVNDCGIKWDYASRWTDWRESTLAWSLCHSVQPSLGQHYVLGEREESEKGWQVGGKDWITRRGRKVNPSELLWWPREACLLMAHHTYLARACTC